MKSIIKKTIFLVVSFYVIYIGIFNLTAEMTSEGVENWGRREIYYKLKANEKPDITFQKKPEACDIKVDTDGVKRSILLKDDEIVVNGKKFDTDNFKELTLSAEKDFLIINIVKTWSKSSSHSSSKSMASDSKRSSSSSSSSSQSSGKSLLSFGFTRFNGEIEFRLEGGDSIESSIKKDLEKCIIEFDIDKGKNKRTIVIKPNSMTIDNEQKKIGAYTKLQVIATKRRDSLRIQIDRKDVWAKKKG